MSSLFGHLVPRFASKPEDVSTEALCYVLRQSEAARQKFIGHLEQVLGIEVDPELRFSTQQTAEDDGIPDLWGKARDQRVLIEVKFWAGLTGRQSSAYDDSFGDTDGACLFLVPEERVENIKRKMKEVYEKEDAPILGVTHWSAVLSALEAAVEESTENNKHQILGDLQQLRGLCRQLKAEGFHPIRPDELGPDVARRMLDLRRLVEELREILLTDTFASWSVTSNMRRRTSVYRFKGELYKTTYFLGIHYNLWKDLEDSPLWMKFKDERPTRREEIKTALRPKMTVLDHPQKQEDVLIPLELRIGVSRDQIVDNLEEQLSTISEELSDLSRLGV
jgi:regulator of replication initiation timing